MTHSITTKIQSIISYFQHDSSHEVTIFQPTPLLPGITNVLGAPLDIKDTSIALKRSIQIGDVSTRNRALVRIASALLSFGQAIISCFQKLFTFFQLSPACGFIALALSCNITALVLCSVEGGVEAISLSRPILFLKKPFFHLTKFLSLPSSKNPIDSLKNYLLQIEKNRKKFENFLGKKTVQTFLDDCKKFTTSSAPICASNSAFQKMKRSVLTFHLSYFYRKNFTLSLKKEKKLAKLQKQIALLTKYKSSPHAIAQNSAIREIFQKYQPKRRLFFNKQAPAAQELISFLSKRENRLKNRVRIAQISLSKNLGHTFVQNILKNKLPGLLKDLAAKSDTSLALAENLVFSLQTQAIKKACLHALGMTVVILTLIGVVLLFCTPGGGIAATLLMVITALIGMGRYVFEKSVLDESGWHVDFEKSIPPPVKKIFLQITRKKAPLSAIRV